MKIGAQLFTVRDYCKNLDDFARTLERVAEIGYQTVQVSGTCAFDAEWLAQRLKRTGLQCVLTHTPGDRIVKETEQVVREHDAFGCRYVGLGWYGFDAEKGMAYEDFVTRYGAAARALRIILVK